MRRRRWILFLLASYFRSGYNKVSSFDKTSRHEFPKSRENVNIMGKHSADGKKRQNRRDARRYLVSRGETSSKISLFVGKLRALSLQGASDYRPYHTMTRIFDGRISQRGWYLCWIWHSRMRKRLMEMQNWQEMLVILRYQTAVTLNLEILKQK